MRKTLFVLFSLALAGCGAARPGLLSEFASRMPTSELWQSHAKAKTPEGLAIIEAELATRGQFSFGRQYLGQKTAAAYGQKLYGRPATYQTGGKNCDDFASTAEAQLHFIRRGGPQSDPDGLDRDGDGLACEWGKKLAANAKRYKKKAPMRRTAARPAPVRRSYGATCHVGPRGGTYTITASGRKNYGGC